MNRLAWALVLVLVFATLAACDADDDDDDDDDNDAAGDDDAADDDVTDDDDAAGDDDDPGPVDWPDCDRIADNTPLHEKAAAFDRVSRERHIAGDGLLRTITLTEDLSEVAYWHHVPNTILWSGMYLASQAFRFAVTGEQEAVENARTVVAALRQLTDVTGVTGLYGRSMARPDVAYNYDGSGHPSWIDSPVPAYEGWSYNNDVSKDGYDGLMFGYAAALQHFTDADLLADVTALVAEVADHLMRNGLQIIDADGEVTEHGRMFHTAADDFPGFNALLVSSWLKVALDATGDAALDDFYYGCLMRTRGGVPCPDIERLDIGSYVDSMETTLMLFLPFCRQSYDQFDMSYQAIYPLMTRETDQVLQDRFAYVLDQRMWRREFPASLNIRTTDTFGYSLFTFIYAALIGHGDEDLVLLQAMDDAVCTLKEFPDEKYERHIPIGTQRQVCTSRLDEPVAKERIPLMERYFDNYIWRLDPYVIETEERPENRRVVHSPEDFLVAYWLGRYYGFVDEEL